MERSTLIIPTVSEAPAPISAKKRNQIWQDGVVRPDITATDVIKVIPAVDFLYVMRKDNRFTVNPIVEQLAQDGIDPETAKAVLHEEYEAFFAGLADQILESFEYKRTSPDNIVQLHVYDAEGIERKALDRSLGAVVSADPLKVGVDGVGQVHVSRQYLMGGTRSTGLIARPGTAPLEEQIAEQKALLGNAPTTVADDDAFTGGTIAKLSKALINGGINVEHAVFDIQMGQPEEVQRMGVSVDAAMTYLPPKGKKIDEVSDLGDPRDFLLGASGLVMKMPNGEYGRVPYVLPFVSPAARMGLPVEEEAAFSQDVLGLNYAFFDRVGQKLGHELELRHMDHHFMQFMKDTYGMDPRTSMKQVVIWAAENMQTVRADIETIGQRQSELHDLNLPEQPIIFAEVSQDSINSASAEDISILIAIQSRLQQANITLGIQTREGLAQAQELAALLQNSGPVLAEGGAVLSHREQSIRYRNPESVTNTTREEVLTLLQKLGKQVGSVSGASISEINTTLAGICEMVA